MALLVFFGVVGGLLILRMAPGLLLRLVLALPRRRIVQAIRMVRTRRTVTSVGPLPAANPFRWLLVSSSLLALLALVTTAILKWHPADLMMLLR